MINLPPEIYSRQQLEAVTAELKAGLRLLQQAEVKQRSGVNAAAAAPEYSPEAKALLTAAGIEPSQAPALEALVTELAMLPESAPQVHVTLAAMPAEGLKKQLAAWLRKNLGPQVLVNFSYHTALLGGMVVRVGSRTFDWSFRRQILAAAPQFAERLSRV